MLIVWPNTFERFRPVILGARYVAISGRLQHKSGVIHIVGRTGQSYLVGDEIGHIDSP